MIITGHIEDSGRYITELYATYPGYCSKPVFVEKRRPIFVLVEEVEDSPAQQSIGAIKLKECVDKFNKRHR
jgi:hypothetical protein